MSGATLHHGTERFSTVPPWPENRIKSFDVQPKTASGKSRVTEVLLAAPAVSNDEATLYNACLVNDLGWWSLGTLALLRTLATMGYKTLSDARSDHEAFKEVALARVQEAEKHVIKPFNLGLYFEAVRQLSQPVDGFPLQLLIAQIHDACVNQVLRDASMVLERVAPKLDAASKSKGALAAHADDVKRLSEELTALVAKLKKSKRAAQILQEAAR